MTTHRIICKEDMIGMGIHALQDRRKSKARKEVCLFYHHQKNDTAWCTKEEIKAQCKEFRKLQKQGKLTMIESNNKELSINGKTFYIFVVQHTDEEKDMIDPFAMYHGLLVSGFVYCFTAKYNRDVLYKYIMGIPQDQEEN